MLCSALRTFSPKLADLPGSLPRPGGSLDKWCPLQDILINSRLSDCREWIDFMNIRIVNQLYGTQLSVDILARSTSSKALELPEGSWSALHLQPLHKHAHVRRENAFPYPR